MIIRKSLFCFLVFLFLFLTPTEIFAQVVINEFSFGSSDDWVELFNNYSEQVDLSGYFLIDGSESGNTKTLSCILASKGFLVIDWSNKLNNGGDIIRLKNGDLTVDCVAYGDGAGQFCEGKADVDLPIIGDNEFGVRSEDGGGSWFISETSSKYDSSDCLVPTATPTNTPSPTNTPTPTKTPTPTSTPRPADTSTPTKTPTPKVTITIIPSSQPTGLSSFSASLATPAVLGIEEAVSPTGSGNVSSGSAIKIVLVLGLLFLAAAIITFSHKISNKDK